MAITKKKTVFTTYRDTIPDIMSRFVFDHHAVIDKTGLIVTPQGFARPFYHKPTNTVGLLFSKTANNLRGQGKDGAKRYATEKEIKRCYVIAAYRCHSDSDKALQNRGEMKRLSKRLRNNLDRFCEILGERNQKHFTGFMTDNIFTNGRLTYEIVKRKNNRFDVILSLPTVRKDGHFVPFDLDDRSLSGYFSRLSKTVAKCNSYKAARFALTKHWQGMSSELWDEKNIFKGKGRTFMARKLMADFTNATIHHAASFTATMGVIGGGTTLLKPEYTLMAGLFGAIGHAVAHHAVEKFLETGHGRYKHLKDAKSRLDIQAYPYDEDVSDHFKIQTIEEIDKLCPHMDLTRFHPEEFEFPEHYALDLLKDREKTQSNLRATCLEGHLLFMHQRGFSSICNMIDKRTDIRFFQSGVVRLMHEKSNGNIVVFAQYRPDLCIAESQRLPEHYMKQFNDGIVRVEYDRAKPTFSGGIVKRLENVAYKDMVREIERDFLYTYQPISWDVRSLAYKTIAESFTNVKAPKYKNDFHLTPPPLVGVNALQSHRPDR